MVQRENPEASIANYNEDRKKQWTWSQYDGNRPTKWMQKLFKSTTLPPLGPLQPPRVIYELDPLGTREEHYLYDADGNRTTVVDAQGDTLNVVRYNRLNLPEEYVSADGDTLKYVYSADGEKLYVEERSSATSGAQGTEYAANYRIENGTVTMIHTDAGYYTIATPPAGGTAPVFEHLWYLKDHLGNNRVLANERGIALTTHHYDPYGTEISISISNPSNPFLPGMADSPYKYGGKECVLCEYDPENRGSDGGCRCRWWSGGWTTISKNRGKMPMVVHGVDHCQHLREAYDGDKPLVPEIRAQPGRGTYTCGT